MSFCHLHLHTEYSILDGNTKIDDVPKIVSEMGHTSVAVTDHGSMGGSLRFTRACAEYNVKPIIGMEGYITPDLSIKEKDTPIWHMVLLGSGEEGKRSLFGMSQVGWTEGFYKKPRIDYPTLNYFKEGVIATSSCMAGEVARAMQIIDEDGTERWEENEAALTALYIYKSILGENFYVELQPGNPAHLNHALANLAEEAGLKTVVSVDSHYSDCGSKAYEEMLLIMQQVSGMKPSEREHASLMYEDAKREDTLMKRLNTLWPTRSLRFDHHDLHIMTRDEVVERMDAQGFDGNALADTTLEIAEKCEGLTFKMGQVYLPKVGGSDPENTLKRMVREGLEAKGLFDKEEYRERAKEELAVITGKNFTNYFLIVGDLIAEARRRNIYVGPGRGSAAGSLVTYALGITSLDPIEYNLLFFRFLNPERNDYPDIDMDFEHTRRDELKDYFNEKYGEAISLGTYSVWKPKSLLKGIARALAIPLSEVNNITKHFDSVEEYKTSEQVKSFRAKHPEITPIMEKFVGQVQASGMHAAGVVIADRPLHHIVPIESRPNPEDKKTRVPVAAFDMSDSESVGLIKYDFLGLTNLSVIHDCIDLIAERTNNKPIDWEALKPEDPNIFKMLSEGHTVGVFQMESAAYRKLLVAQGVDSFEDLVASNALVRPGAWLTVAKDFINRKHGREEVTYPHPSVEDELKHTYGVYIYQEQVMQLAVKLGGFSWSEADRLRKIIGKKKDASEFQPFFEKWLANAGELIGVEEAEKMWHNFEAHSGYSFNRSHAVCYSYIGYVTAWLKYYYPTEYIYSLLKNEKKDTNKMTYLLEAKRLGIPILGPDVHHSDHKMKVEQDGSLRFGLSDIKNVGFAASKELIEKRPFGNWDDLQERVVKQKIDSRVIESLEAVDALRSVDGAPKNDEPEKNFQKFLNYPVDLEEVAKLGISFDEVSDYNEDDGNFVVVCGVTKNLKRTPRYTRIDIEDISGTLTAFGRDGNDLDNNEVIIALVGDKTVHAYARVDGLKERIELGNLNDMEKFFLGNPWGEAEGLRKWGFGGFNAKKALAIPINIRRITTKKNKDMAWITLWDGEEYVVAACFPQTWEQTKTFFHEFKPVCVKLDYMDSGGRKVAWNGAADALEILEKKESNI